MSGFGDVSGGYRVWIGTMSRDVTTQLLNYIFARYGEMSAGISLRINIRYVDGAEAVITYRRREDAELAIREWDCMYILEERIYVTPYGLRRAESLF